MPTTRALPVTENNSSTKNTQASRPVHRRKRSRVKSWLKKFLILGLIAGLGYGGHYAVKNDMVKLGTDAPVYEETADEPLTKVIGSGYVDVRRGTTDVRPKIPGQITKLLVEENVVVKKGKPLFQMDTTEAEYQKTMAENAIKEARLKLKQLQDTPADMSAEINAQIESIKAAQAQRAGLELQLKEVNRLLALRTPQAKQATKDALEQTIKAQTFQIAAQQEILKGAQNKEQDYKKNRENLINQANQAIKSLQVSVDRAENLVKQHTVLAPYDGYVLRWNVNVGDTVTPVPPAPAALVFCSNERVIVRAEIDQEWGHLVKPNMAATIRDDAQNDLKWEGKVEKIARWYVKRRNIFPEPGEMNDIRTRECIVDLLEDPKHPLAIGQRVRVQIELEPEK